jgi:hypothetical protein
MLDMALDLSLSPRNMPRESGAVSSQEIKQLHEASAPCWNRSMLTEIYLSTRR